MGIFFKHSGDEDFEEKRISNNTKAPLIVYDERNMEAVHIPPGQSKIILKRIPVRLPRKIEIIRGNYEG